MRTLLTPFSLAILSLVVVSDSTAGLITMRWESTVEGGTNQPPQVTDGQSFVMSMTLDNNDRPGASSQAWSIRHLIDVSVSVGDGAYTWYLAEPRVPIWPPPFSVGNFATNSDGELIAVPISWTRTGTVIDSSIGTWGGRFALGHSSSFPDEIYTYESTPAVTTYSIGTATSHRVISDWSIVDPTTNVVPEPTSFAIFGLGAFALILFTTLKRNGPERLAKGPGHYPM